MLSWLTTQLMTTLTLDWVTRATTSQQSMTIPMCRSIGPPGYLLCPAPFSSTRLLHKILLHSAEKPKEILYNIVQQIIFSLCVKTKTILLNCTTYRLIFLWMASSFCKYLPRCLHIQFAKVLHNKLGTIPLHFASLTQYYTACHEIDGPVIKKVRNIDQDRSKPGIFRLSNIQFTQTSIGKQRHSRPAKNNWKHL